MDFDWGNLAFTSKKPLTSLRATFIAAPRELSIRRFTQLVKQLLPRGNIILGLAKEPYIDGFENQPQFKTLQINVVQSVIDKVNQSTSPYKIHTLQYFQRELPFVLEKTKCQKAVFINGSWKYLFHTRPVFYALVTRNIPYQLVSPFCDETEAREYAKKVEVSLPAPQGTFSAAEMLGIAAKAAACSFDNGFQTGVALGRKRNKGYKVMATTCNNVVPFQTYAMLYGASRETHFSPMHDLNHYDTVHAEVALLVKAQKQGLDLHNTTLFINLLPCPTCARMFTQTDITEFVYREDHSDGYAVQLLQRAGKTVTRLVE